MGGESSPPEVIGGEVTLGGGVAVADRKAEFKAVEDVALDNVDDGLNAPGISPVDCCEFDILNRYI